MKRIAPLNTVLLLVVTIGVCHGAGQAVAAERPPETILLDGPCLARTRASLAEDDSSPRAAEARLIRDAETALKAGPFSVTDNTVRPPSGDKHDYMSFGPYWWPNPKTQDGLPYIQRDGVVNPEGEKKGSDRSSMTAMVQAADTLALAYYFTGEDKYAARAALLLHTWFVEPATRMNPHLQYGQAIPGRVEGRGFGIIDTVRLLNVVDAAILLEGSESWSDEDHAALKQWFGDYLHWLRTSQHGIDESRTRNNHGTWYDAQVACFALFVDDRETARSTLESSKENRVLRQISPDGRQEHELARTRSFGYSLMNLNGMFCLARLGEHVGIDLWHVEIEGKPALQAALDYVAPYADARKEWPHEEISKSRPIDRLLPLLRRGYMVYRKPEYLAMIGKFPEEIRLENRSALLYPLPIAPPDRQTSGANVEARP
ncbi:MAG: alginate lyase family protein [Pirellulaceae bacterium]|nr:alginate lyase family protein [Pirellulaceae bacterium]